MTANGITRAMREETFECDWCKVLSGATEEEYTKPISELAGYDKHTGLPVCNECAEVDRHRRRDDES